MAMHKTFAYSKRNGFKDLDDDTRSNIFYLYAKSHSFLKNSLEKQTIVDLEVKDLVFDYVKRYEFFINAKYRLDKSKVLNKPSNPFDIKF